MSSKKDKKGTKKNEVDCIISNDENIIQETNQIINEIEEPDISLLENHPDLNKTNAVIKNEKVSNDNIKKRGRKPKGGKIVQQLIANENNKENKINIILHLKCSLKDLQSNNDSPLEYYNFINDFHYEFLKNESLKSEISSNQNVNDISSDSSNLEKNNY